MEAPQLQQHNVFDLTSLNRLRQDALNSAGKGDESRQALKQAAQQFESIFTQMLLKSMRKANEAFEDKDSPFNASGVKFFQDMHDQQLATELSNNGSLGLADLIVQQLAPQGTNYTPAEVLRGANALNNQQIKAKANSPTAVVSQPKANAGLHIHQAALNLQANPASSGAKNNTAVTEPNTQPTPPNTFADAQEFVSGIWDMAKQAASKIGLNPAVMVAQAALETGWGKHIIKTAQGESSNNLFNIKSHRDWQGDSASKVTLEYSQGVAVKKRDQFRVYDSLAESFNDFVNFLHSNPRYQQALEHASKPERFIDELQRAGYATDPNYAKKIKQLLGQDEIKAFAGQLLGNGE